MGRLNILKHLPPPNKDGMMAIESGEAMRWLPRKRPPGYREMLQGVGRGLEVTAGTLQKNVVGVSAAGLRRPNGTIEVQGWTLGEDTDGEQTTVFVVKAGLLHALLFVGQYLDAGGEFPLYVRVRAGERTVVNALLKWFNEDALGLRSAAGSDVICALSRLRGKINCSLLV